MDQPQEIVDIQLHGQAIVAKVLCAEVVEQTEIRRMEATIVPVVEDGMGLSVVMDFTEVRFISSPFLGFLMSLRNKVHQRRGRLLVCCLGQNIKHTKNDTYIYELFKIVQLDKFFELFDSPQAALAHLQTNPAT